SAYSTVIRCPLDLQLLPPSLHAFLFSFNHPATTEIYTLSLHDALPISCWSARSPSRRRRSPGSTGRSPRRKPNAARSGPRSIRRSEEHTSELQSRGHLVCRLLLEKKKKKHKKKVVLCVTVKHTVILMVI